ncbi:MAG: type II toxin-antitoxin system RelE/ParE family toxin [Acidobacteriia bacterium]|nr:type II toxin-antitoxin system RelE/ParE family toxin [Terriglobia bacterium]MBV8904472.1 type II toxin-antitoxin system RelE/ParE family toxin [Terriglobia bacterium]
MTVVESPFFLKKAAALLKDDEREGLISFIGLSPEAGDIIPETGGVRKLRWAGKSKGKRGGVRVIYYFHDETLPVFLLTVYAKNQKANLTKAERNELRQLVPLLVKSYGQGRQI